MRSFLGTTAFLWLHFVVAVGLGFMGLGVMVLLADLVMPNQTGLFVLNGTMTGAGVLARPVGQEVLGSSLRVAAVLCITVSFVSSLAIHQLGLRMLQAVSNGFAQRA